MDDQDEGDERRSAEAAQWFARLKTVPVSIGTLDAFFDWQRDPANAAAFEEAENVWGQAAQLGARPAMLRLRQEALARGSKGRHARKDRGFGLTASVCLAVTLCTLGAWVVLRTPSTDYATNVGEQRAVALADGSHLQLGTDTQLETKLGNANRRVRVEQGEALFEVAHDRSRPFIVTAGDVEVLATGTRFDVRRVADITTVVLFEGGVEVRADGVAPVRLRPGESWRSDRPAGSAVEPANVGQALAWTQGRLAFDATPLATAVAEVNRYSAQKIVLTAASRQGEPISGSFKAGDSEAFAKAVAAMLSLKATQQSDGSISLGE